MMARALPMIRGFLTCALLAGLLACGERDAAEPAEAAPEPAAAKATVDEAPSAKSDPSPKTAPAPKPTATEPAATADGEEQQHSVIHTKSSTGEVSAIEVAAPKGWEIVRAPTEPDPHAGRFSLAQATAGLQGKGTLVAHIETSMGSFYCDLFDDKAPKTVANFVGLARGKRKFWDDQRVEWTARPYYDGTTFHRVIPGFMIQGGDHTLTGRGRIGYTFGDELTPDAKHDRGGLLCMANRGKGINESQFFITERAAPHIDGSYTIFGQCEPLGLVQRIARVPQSGSPLNRPKQDVVIRKVAISRVVGGAAKAMPDSAKLPPLPGVVPSGQAVLVPPGGQPPLQGQSVPVSR